MTHPIAVIAGCLHEYSSVDLSTRHASHKGSCYWASWTKINGVFFYLFVLSHSKNVIIFYYSLIVITNALILQLRDFLVLNYQMIFELITLTYSMKGMSH